MTAALPLALLCGLSLASAALSFLVLARIRMLAGAAERRTHAQSGQFSATIEAVGKAVENLSEEVRELSRCPPVRPDGRTKPGMNLSTRSQALRMHRRGESAEQIAATLSVSRQEIDLLLKVHRIVMARC